LTSLDDIILGALLNNNAYHHLKSSNNILLTIVEAGLDARLAIGIFIITAMARLAPLRFAHKPRDIGRATTDLIWSAAFIHAAVFLLRLFAEVFQFHLWPQEIRVNLQAFIWLILLAILPLWIIAMYRWMTIHRPGQNPAISNKGTAP